MKTQQTKISSKEDRLLQARQEVLQQPLVGSLRSHGKLWGMDVFSWYKAPLHELESTLQSFPDSICWYGNRKEIIDLSTRNPDAMQKVHMVCAYDQAGFHLSNELLDQMNIVLGAAKIQDALDILSAFKKQHKILLFTSSSENWKRDHEVFQMFLEENQ
ncbi:MAG: hypothetical protein EP338_06510 [Bacteroidetes bacterium]|nr:MAG: hypothetical protein EP338_06510 [Bacteroidota bacterium]